MKAYQIRSDREDDVREDVSAAVGYIEFIGAALGVHYIDGRVTYYKVAEGPTSG